MIDEAGVRKDSGPSLDENAHDIKVASQWFAEHVRLFGQPYTLDDDQVRAAIDTHRNTLVTARAGSGKTRVIVAKVAYLVAKCGYNFDEIAIFMFNRTAAAEVNQRIAAVEVDGRPLSTEKLHIASTFHKFALDLVKASGEHPEIVDEASHVSLIFSALEQALNTLNLKYSLKEQQTLLGIASGFIARAGQQYPGPLGLGPLTKAVVDYCARHANQPSYRQKILWHRIALQTYTHYVKSLVAPKTDFNFLMAHASEILCQIHANSMAHPLKSRLSELKIIMIDEYQDFSYLFYSLVQGLRQLAPDSRLFAVGDDWQAINRFAGSDVNYFINFASYFPENQVNIPLATNYRSCRRIVERANQYMLANYDPEALPAKAFSPKLGKIHIINPEKTRFNAGDILEDAKGDGRFQLALSEASGIPVQKIPKSAAKLLKTLVQIIRRHHQSEFMLLHRHNFTSLNGISLAVLMQSLRQIITTEAIMTPEAFDRQIRCMTMHKSKGLEAEIVILLELNREIVCGSHPHATIFELFGDTRSAEIADQERLLYVALTRAKKRLYLLSSDKTPPV